MTEPVPLEPDTQRYRLHGVERALDTLELLAAAGPGGMTLTELAERISVSKSSAFASYLGQREYPHCTSAGKALLSALPLDQARALALESGMPPRTGPHHYRSRCPAARPGAERGSPVPATTC